MGTYRYRQFDWRPGAVLQKSLAQSRIAVVTSAAFSRPDQPPFDASIRDGDYSFREIPVETEPLATLAFVPDPNLPQSPRGPGNSSLGESSESYRPCQSTPESAC